MRNGEEEEALPRVRSALGPSPHTLAPPHPPHRVRPPRREPPGPTAVEDLVTRGAQPCARQGDVTRDVTRRNTQRDVVRERDKGRTRGRLGGT